MSDEKLPWPKAWLVDVHREVAFFNCHAPVEYAELDQDCVLIKESDALAFKKLCEMAMTGNFDDTNIVKFSKKLWREIFQEGGK